MSKKPDNNDAITIYEQIDGKKTFLPFRLPEQRVGKFQIKHKVYPKDSELCVVSMRNAIFMGLSPAKLILQDDTIAHFLFESEDDNPEGGLWMSTRPQEIEQHQRQLREAHGRVLVGGLGLGLAVGILHKNDNVDEITVIENSADVLAMVKPYLPLGKTVVLQADIYEFLKQAGIRRNTYDFAFYDTWCPTSQYVLLTEVMPLRQLSIDVVHQDCIECWNEDEMIGQVAMGVHNWVGQERDVMRKMMKDQLGGDPFEMPLKEFRQNMRYNKEAYPFFAWMHDKKPKLTQAQFGAQRYMKALKDAVMYNEFWKHYENYGAETDKPDKRSGTKKGDKKNETTTTKKPRSVASG